MNSGSEQSPPPGTDPSSTRRQALTLLSLALGGLGAFMAGVPVVGFLLGPLLKQRPPRWVGVGAVDKFTVGQTVKVTFADPGALPWAGVAGKTAAWLRREPDDSFVAFDVNCSHLGCPVRWEPSAELFMCPCHGGVYYGNGQVAGGPPPEPLHRVQTRVHNGQVQLQTRPLPIT
jgi:menaquinol-cytochrome c reductase iron-sulfur subunit